MEHHEIAARDELTVHGKVTFVRVELQEEEEKDARHTFSATMRSLSTLAQPMPGIITSNDFDAFVFDGTATPLAVLASRVMMTLESPLPTRLLSETLEKLI